MKTPYKGKYLKEYLLFKEQGCGDADDKRRRLYVNTLGRLISNEINIMRWGIDVNGKFYDCVAFYAEAGTEDECERMTECCDVMEIPLEFNYDFAGSQINCTHLKSGETCPMGEQRWWPVSQLYKATNHEGYLESERQKLKVKTKGLYELAGAITFP